MGCKNIKTILIIALCLLSFDLEAATDNLENVSIQEKESPLSQNNSDRLNSVITYIKKYYHKSVGEKDLVDYIISGTLSKLDPHSSYLGPEDLKNLEKEISGKDGYAGIGIEVAPEHGTLKVITSFDDTPASKAGIKSGDYIVLIDNKLVRDMNTMKAANMLRGKKGSYLTVTIIREGVNKPLIFSLRREEIKLQAVKYRILEPGYGYVRIPLFHELTERDMVQAIKKMQKVSKGRFAGLILDIRNNPGGLFTSAIEVANDFLDVNMLKDNDLIVYTKGQARESQILAKVTPGISKLPNVPMVVLINEGSASAAEIVAGALQDHKRAIVVGIRSFGKGSVQTLFPIDEKSAIKLTTATYYTPLGHSIQTKGIIPDINVENIQLSQDDSRDQAWLKVHESLLTGYLKNGDKNNDFLYPLLKDHRQKPPKTECDLAYKDYQLYAAFHILKSQNIIRKTVI